MKVEDISNSTILWLIYLGWEFPWEYSKVFWRSGLIIKASQSILFIVFLSEYTNQINNYSMFDL
jgi:hypothetical protein